MNCCCCQSRNDSCCPPGFRDHLCHCKGHVHGLRNKDLKEELKKLEKRLVEEIPAEIEEVKKAIKQAKQRLDLGEFAHTTSQKKSLEEEVIKIKEKIIEINQFLVAEQTKMQIQIVNY